MVMRWVSEPRTAQWFTDANYDAELADHLTDVRIDQWIVLLAGHPLAYLQDYRIDGWDGHPLGDLPKGARGIDTLIGSEAEMGKGIGPRYLAQHCQALFGRGVPALGIDPHPDNHAAIRAYEKVGFQAGDRITSQWGAVRVMTLWPND